MKCHDNTKYVEAWVGVNDDNKSVSAEVGPMTALELAV